MLNLIFEIFEFLGLQDADVRLMDIRHKPTVALLFLKEQLLEFLFCFLHLKPRLLLLTVAFVELTAVLWCEACLSGHE